MTKGTVTLDRTSVDVLLFGLGSSNLFFNEESSNAKTEVMTPSDVCRGYYCKNCGALTIAAA
jgi:hypothetical protein